MTGRGLCGLTLPIAMLMIGHQRGLAPHLAVTLPMGRLVVTCSVDDVICVYVGVLVDLLSSLASESALLTGRYHCGLTLPIVVVVVVLAYYSLLSV